jgi:hypothetical protein
MWSWRKLFLLAAARIAQFFSQLTNENITPNFDDSNINIRIIKLVTKAFYLPGLLRMHSAV